MFNRVTFITAAVFATLFAAGCVKTLDPASGDARIRFDAGSALLRDDATSKASLKEGVTFANGDVITVFGTHTSGSEQTLVFDGVDVRKETFAWTYSPARSWEWLSTGDYYDFAAVWPSGKGTARMNVSGNLAISTHYDLMEGDNYDLMAATNRRRGNVMNPSDTVRLSFNHMNSAVQVVVINSSDTKAVNIDSVKFKNLMVCGDAKVTLDNFGESLLSWINTERNRAEVCKTEIDSTVAAGARCACGHDLMIPQRLDQAAAAGGLDADMPTLILKYTPAGAVQSTANILLKGVKRQDGTEITSWEPGVRYVYYVTMRLDGGVLVSIVTTAWDDVEMETPGLLI